MRILGIDPGIATIGFGMIDSQNGSQKLISYGVISTEAGLPLSVRLVQIESDLSRLILSLKPDASAVEELFFNTNAKTGLSVAHGRGVILLALEKLNIPIYEYTPLQVKQAVVGYGRAEKKQVMDMTKRLLKIDKTPRPDDAADALAIALCHGRSSTSLLNLSRGR